MKLFLIRHGQTTGDIEDRYGGTYDDHLTALGQQQLRATAELLTKSGIQIVYHSPLIRARESAEIIGYTITCPLVEVSDIKERDYGILGGLTKTEALAQFPEAVEAHKDHKNTDPEGESWDDFDSRVVIAFTEICAQAASNSYHTIAIVAHGGSIKRILEHLDEPLPTSIADGGVIEISCNA